MLVNIQGINQCRYIDNSFFCGNLFTFHFLRICYDITKSEYITWLSIKYDSNNSK